MDESDYMDVTIERETYVANELENNQGEGKFVTDSQNYNLKFIKQRQRGAGALI